MTSPSRPSDSRQRRAARVVGAAIVVLIGTLLAGCSTASGPKPEVLTRPDDCTSATAARNAGTLTPELISQLDGVGLGSETWSQPPTADDLERQVGLPPGVDPALKPWKSPIFLAPHTTGTVSVVSPASARLFATTWAHWRELKGSEIITQQTTKLTLHGCNGIATYPGLVVLRGPACVTLEVRAHGSKPKELRIPFFGATC